MSRIILGFTQQKKRSIEIVTGNRCVGRRSGFLKAAGPARSALASRYRVELTSAGHPGIPEFYGWRLLAAADASLPRTSPR